MRILAAGHLSFFGIVGIATVALALSGCPERPSVTPPASPSPEKVHSAAKARAEPATKHDKESQKPAASSQASAKPGSPEVQVSEAIEEAAKKPRDLGSPLVDNLNDLKKHPEQPVWVDARNRQIVLLGEVCSAGYPLEFFATYPNRSYEAVLSVNAQPSVVHACLLAIGAEPGHPVKFQPKFSPPTGTEVAIEVRWKDAQGKIQSKPAQYWIRNIKTKKELDTNWVFAGSMFVSDDAGNKSYLADSGELICVLNLQGAMLDLPMRSDSGLESRSFEAFTEHLPPQGTATTVILKPILPLKPPPPLPQPPAKAGGNNFVMTKAQLEQAEKEAIAAATAWLALLDRNQLSQAWDAAAEPLKAIKDRRDFIKLIADARKPLGTMKSRQLESKQYATTLPRAPAGQYFVLQFKTSFANRKSAVETITPMLDKDKKWRVSGYYVK
jgi:hypothetical protein